MKKLIVISCLLASAFNAHARAIQEEQAAAGEKARTSYAFGMIIGSELLSTDLDIDYAAFTRGLKNVMESEETNFTHDEAIEIVQNAFHSAMTKQAEENQFKEALFLSENAERDGVRTTSSGLQYEVLSEGGGARPVRSDIVRVHYEGMLTNGTKFDSSYDRGDPVDIPLNGVIPGWAEGLQLMSVGSKYRFFIPSGLAYGGQGAGPIIPPYSTLVFEVELFEIIVSGFETDYDLDDTGARFDEYEYDDEDEFY
jgi:FKBP-type peptidyl-prolyl cis-trans isomerase